MTERAKLELQLNQPTEIELLYDEPVVGSSQYGAYFLYAVSANGSQYSYFPPESVHEKIKDLRRGDKAVITKYAEQKGSKLITKYDVRCLNVQEARTLENNFRQQQYNPQTQMQSSNQNSYVPQNGNSHNGNSFGGNGNAGHQASCNTAVIEKPQQTDYYYDIMLKSYRDAIAIQHELNGMADPAKIAITLFIARSKMPFSSSGSN